MSFCPGEPRFGSWGGKDLSSQQHESHLCVHPYHARHSLHVPSWYVRAIAAIIQVLQSIFTYWGQTFRQNPNIYHSWCGKFTSLDGFYFFPEKNPSLWRKKPGRKVLGKDFLCQILNYIPLKEYLSFYSQSFLGGSVIGFSCCPDGRNKQWRTCVGYQDADAWLRSWKWLLQIC